MSNNDLDVSNQLDAAPDEGSWLPDLKPENFPEGLQALVKDGAGKVQRSANIIHKIAHSEQAAQATLMGIETALYKLKLDPQLREIAICTIGRVTGAAYEYTHHLSVSRAVGVSEAKLHALPVWRDHPALSDQEQAVIRLTEEISTDIRPTRDTYEAVRAFLSDEEMVELCWVVAFYNAIARVIESLDVRLEGPMPDTSGQAISSRRNIAPDE